MYRFQLWTFNLTDLSLSPCLPDGITRKKKQRTWKLFCVYSLHILFIVFIFLHLAFTDGHGDESLDNIFLFLLILNCLCAIICLYNLIDFATNISKCACKTNITIFELSWAFFSLVFWNKQRGTLDFSWNFICFK